LKEVTAFEKTENYKPTRFMAEGSYYDKDAPTTQYALLKNSAVTPKARGRESPLN
jgi:hypothetical protein